VVHRPEAAQAANIEQPEEFEAAVVDFAREIAYLRAPEPENNRVLMALGGALVFAGLGLLAAAVIFNGGSGGDNPENILAAAPDFTATPIHTQVAQVAGTSVSGQATRPSLPSTAPTVASTSPTAAATAAPQATATGTGTGTAATSTPAQATAAPTSTPQPEPTATSTPAPTATATTPSGPFAQLSGPSTAAVGEFVTVSIVTGGGQALRTDIRLPNGQVVTHTAAEGFTPASPGCYVFGGTAYFASGQVLQTARAVAVGGATCQ
jgi:hypothetical protein